CGGGHGFLLLCCGRGCREGDGHGAGGECTTGSGGHEAGFLTENRAAIKRALPPRQVGHTARGESTRHSRATGASAAAPCRRRARGREGGPGAASVAAACAEGSSTRRPRPARRRPADRR